MPTPRTKRLTAVSSSLTALTDQALRDLLETAVPLGESIGGTSSLLDVAGTPVFVKRVPLTDLETRPENHRSTANLFALPAFCHYGIGSPGFGAWRELAAHQTTTKWVVSGRCSSFPLMYHWRVLPDTAPPPSGELADVERVVAYWGGGPEVRHRVEALHAASTGLVLFLEYIPRTLSEWLHARLRAGDLDRVCGPVDRALAAGVRFINAEGLLHFDAHFENVLTDGHRLYLTDYGLAVSSRFALSPAEGAFLARHHTYDRCYSVTHLVHWLMAAQYGLPRDERDTVVRGYAEGERPLGCPDAVAGLLTRYAPIATVMADFYVRLQEDSRSTPYPLEEIHKVSSARGSPL